MKRLFSGSTIGKQPALLYAKQLFLLDTVEQVSKTTVRSYCTHLFYAEGSE